MRDQLAEQIAQQSMARGGIRRKADGTLGGVDSRWAARYIPAVPLLA